MPLGLVTHRQLQQQLDLIAQQLDLVIEKADILMSTQDEINAEAAQIVTDVTAEAAALAQLKTMVGAATDLSQLQAAVAGLDTETAAEQAAAAAGP